ncbi:ArsI/CadI family heavy metal resistance metalloenzyme [Embleya sp. NPDC005575]|uniref:ArsI/CadI family heavy metal resistance metalloenzyme n=1 Tax=Embleya sp. NPDC005575 TaxID=3156892 RepID=UPI0033A1DA24
MSRVQLALRVADLDASIAFYTKLFGTEPAKLRDGYANFAVAEPPLKLVLIQGEPGNDTVMDHLGVEVESTDQVTAATTRLADAGLVIREENDTTCCYALQDKVWVSGPGNEPWEVYVVKADAATLAKDTDSTCCLPATTTDSGDPIPLAAGAGTGEPASGCCG